ncbi:hypothetical protein MNBD_ALPHA11-1833 [hydrothermal vent metagenome]|uniref:ATP:guanido phosphotransferase YacI n=1 Tax=hydrothermal vent metagenome TaxID=652676 RepID=A0A3B0TS96_9ZZZZ
MTIEKIVGEIEKIKRNHPNNLMARFFNANSFLSLSDDHKKRFMRIINTGIKNPSSEMGAYAMYVDDYEKFSFQLDPMIREFHNIPTESPIAQSNDWDTTKNQCDLGSIDPSLKQISMRVRVARNISTFPLPGAMDKSQRIEFEKLAVLAFGKLADNPAFGGKYLSITPNTDNTINNREYSHRVAAHQMFKDMSADKYLNAANISADWPFGRGMYISQKEDFIIWVGEEDHLRIMAMQTGGNLNDLFERLHTGLKFVGDLLPPFAISPKYGAIASCPTNLGAGMRASLHIKLPNLCANDLKLVRIGEEAKKLGLAVRGAGGEHSGAGEGGLVDISPSARLGVTQMQIMQTLYDGVAALWALENSISN